MTKWMWLLVLTVGCGVAGGDGVSPGEVQAQKDDLASKYGLTGEDVEFAYALAEAQCEYQENCVGYGSTDGCVEQYAEALASQLTAPGDEMLGVMGWTCEDLPALHDECVEWMWGLAATCDIYGAMDDPDAACASQIWSCDAPRSTEFN